MLMLKAVSRSSNVSRKKVGLCSILLLSGVNPVISSIITNVGDHGAVASESKICSELGADLIKRGVGDSLLIVDLMLITWYRAMLQMRWSVLLFALES